MKKQQFTSYEEFINAFSVKIPDNFNFAFDIVDAAADNTPDCLAMIHVDDHGNVMTYDLNFFSRESSRLANVLQEKGIQKGDRVMVMLFRRVEFWVTMLALHKIGGVAIPSPFMLTSKDIEYRVNHADIRGIIADHTLTPVIDRGTKNCPGLSLFIEAGSKEPLEGWDSYTRLVSQAPADFPRHQTTASGKDPLLIFFSSGTTGAPKMVEHTHEYPLGHMTTGIYWHDLKPGDIQLTLADTGWGKALWGKFYGQLMAKATIFVYDFRGKFNPARLLEMMSRHKITTFCAPPTVYRFLIQEDLSRYDLSSLRHCTTAGELLNESVFTSWKNQTGLPIYEGYGQTETALQIATFPFMDPKPGSIGKPVPGVPVVLLDKEGNTCPPGVEGEICIDLGQSKPPGLFTGYLNEALKTEKAFSNGVYHTGDKAWMDEDGYFWFLGRVDDIIKSSGYRIGPFEVESALVSHDAVLEAAVTGISDDIRGQAVKATVVVNQGCSPGKDLTKALQAHVKQVTAPYKYPRIIEYVEELPKTLSGKIKRAEIRARDSQ